MSYNIERKFGNLFIATALSVILSASCGSARPNNETVAPNVTINSQTEPVYIALDNTNLENKCTYIPDLKVSVTEIFKDEYKREDNKLIFVDQGRIISMTFKPNSITITKDGNLPNNATQTDNEYAFVFGDLNSNYLLIVIEDLPNGFRQVRMFENCKL